eukprot:scpid51590/ scgid12753/ 
MITFSVVRAFQQCTSPFSVHIARRRLSTFQSKCSNFESHTCKHLLLFIRNWRASGFSNPFISKDLFLSALAVWTFWCSSPSRCSGDGSISMTKQWGMVLHSTAISLQYVHSPRHVDRRPSQGSDTKHKRLNATRHHLFHGCS